MSKRFELNRTDVNKWLKNTAIFFAPAALIFFTMIQQGKSIDEAMIAIKLWALNVTIDIIKKFISEN